ncbi:S9 family peptidase [Rubrivivax albus]|uniref:S9 family peptidase n=2 Tax=Rubrivivax albus TaxID=2499835 RepID=A0A3S2X1L2_9BURK|nr:S9 family peptidase [Rubrivivax albus]
MAALIAGCAAPGTTPMAANTAAAPVPPQIPLRDFFRNIDRGYYRVSGDGRTLGFMQPALGDDGKTKRLNIFVQPLDGSRPVGEPRQLTRESARDISNYFWKGGDTLLYTKDFGGDENFHVVAVDAASGKITDLTPFENVRAAVLDDLPQDPQHVLVQHNQRDKRAFDVYRVNVKTGAQTLVAQNPGNIIGWQTDHTGAVRMGVASDGVNNTLLYRATEAEPFKPLLTTDFRTQVNPQFFDAANAKFYAISNRGRDKAALVLIDPAKPDAEELIYAHPKVDLDGAAWSRVRQTLALAAYNVDKPGRHYFDAETRRMFERLEKQLPGNSLILQSATLAEDKYVVAAFNDRTQGARYLYDAKADTLALLGEISPWLKTEQMAAMQPIRYTARDGLEIPGYLTLPLGRPAKNLPCVVNPHGGPWARDGWGFNPEVQFLANRGYCVLQMNFRGSTGFGRAFWEASFKQWGLAMQDDITDGVQWLIQQGIADPKRIAIYGASYGGYATLSGVTKTPDLYAAAVNYVGVSNLFTFMNTIPPYWEPFRQQMYQMVGNPEDAADKARMTATSPALNADKIKTPLLVAQGARDPRVNKAESDQIVAALRARGVDVEYIVKDNEGHGFANEENRFEFYGAMERFLAKHLKP